MMTGSMPQKNPTKTFANTKAKKSTLGRPASSNRRPPSSGAVNNSHSINESISVSGSMVFPKGATPQQQEILAELRAQMKRNEAEILKLQREKDRYASLNTGRVTTDDLLRKIRERDSEVRDVQHQFDQIEAEFIKKEKIFMDSKAYMEELIKQIHEAKINNQTLSHKNIVSHIQFSQTKALHDQLRDLDDEKARLETSIRTITSEPFLNRGKDGGPQSTLKRMQELEEKLIQKDKAAKGLKEEEFKKQAELKALIPQVERLKGERDLLEKENKKLKEKFTQNAAKFEEFNVHQTLFQMDPHRYGQALGDLSQRQESYPVWANLDFLERPLNTESSEGAADASKNRAQQVNSEIKQLRFEIMKLRHENKDFAAELEKAQNLLHLQRDIERDNTKYFDQEKERLMVMQKQVSMKAEELARRADEKNRQVYDIEKKLGLSAAGLQTLASPQKGSKTLDDLRASVAEKLETQSEFSAVTNESEIRGDENVLDLAIQDAEYYFDAFKNVLDEKELILHQKTLVTFVTVDFYNHDTETSQLAEGFRPLYNTQFSFKNRVDDFYVQFLQKQTVKLDIYISKNNAAIHLGHAEIFLRDLIERETPLQDAYFKTPIIQKPVRIFGATRKSVNSEQHLGVLKIKMRLRRPVGEAVRFFREKNEIENVKALEMTRAADGELNANSRKKMVTIQIVGCKDLNVKYGEVTNVSPFFYYQFYDFDERYSATAVGKNPVFEDTQNFEIIFDAKMIHYLQREPLEVILFDDNAPITGVDRGAQAAGEQADDMIGSCMIPLADLIKGASIHDRYPIRKLGGVIGKASESVGTLEAKISIIDIDMGGVSQKQVHSQATLQYNKAWETKLIDTIARRLARLPGDVELLFGVFARGQKSVTKEDFKYTCLKRLQLSKDISEREMDMFLRGCPQLLDKEIVSFEDYRMLFSASITHARHDLMDEEAVQRLTINRYEQQLQQQRSFNGGRMTFEGGATNVFQEGSLGATFNRSNTPQNIGFSEQEILDILMKMRNQQHVVLERFKQLSQGGGSIPIDQALAVLIKEGGIGQYDAGRVCNFFNQRGQINIMQFEDFLRQALNIFSLNSASLQKFKQIVQSSLGESMARQIIAQDIDKDGHIGLEGFKAAVLAPEFQFRIDQAAEVFNLLQRDGYFTYRDYLIDINPSLKNLVLGSVRAPSSATTSQVNIMRSENLMDGQLNTGRNLSMIQPAGTQPHDMSINESRMSLGHVSSSGLLPVNHSTSMYIPEDPRMRIIKNKLKQYIQEQDITLATLFKLIDTNSDQQLTLSEFKTKMRALQTNLDDGEMTQLFQHIDRASRGTIDYQLFVQAFPEINISYMVKKIKNILIGSKVTLESVYNEHCSDKTPSRKMSQADFKRFVKKYIEKAADHEIDSLFRHFAVDVVAGITGQLTLNDFTDAFGREVKELSNNVACSIEDIIKPLATKIQKFKVNVSSLFERYDKNQNRKLSAEELALALEKDMKLTLQEDEIAAIKQYFKNRHNTTEIAELDFIALLSMKFARSFDEVEAKKALSLIKQKVYVAQGRTALHICRDFDSEDLKRLSLRNFKHALHSLKLLTQFQIDNLTKYLDADDDGFISVDRFDVELRGAANAASVGGTSAVNASGSFGRQSSTVSGKRTQKW